MICPTCQGRAGYPPCPECGGSGLVYCCEGESGEEPARVRIIITKPGVYEVVVYPDGRQTVNHIR